MTEHPPVPDDTVALRALRRSPRRAGLLVAAGGRATVALFTATTFLSALLLFSIQPMFAKMVLPLLGGSPSVWAVALLFFQGALLAGYGYAHLLMRSMPAGRTGFVHLALCLAAFISLPVGIPAAWQEPPAGEPYLWQLGLFTVAIGLPFAAVAANAPLLQAWFARTGNAQSADPYFLYAASNLGSLLALLGYPFVLEPVFGLKALGTMWTAGFVALLAALALSFSRVWRMADGAAAVGAVRSAAAAAPTWQERLEWVGLAFVPSALLVAFTTHVATDVASAPLIWVIPLALYLLTFVIVFHERALVPPRLLLIVHLGAVILALLQLSQTRHETWFLTAGLGIAAFFTSALVAHRTLYEARPEAEHLTEFYMWLSFGGALGGLFAALIAPKLFSEVFEYPLLLALTMACRPGALAILSRHRSEPMRLLLVLVLGILLILLLPWAAGKLGLTFRDWGPTPVLVLAFAAAMLAFWHQPPRQLAAALLMFLAVVLLPSYVHRGAAERSYFGVYRVIVSGDGQFNVLEHGTTLHGAQRVRGEDGEPVADITPVTYYYPQSPMAQAVRLVRNGLAAGGAKGRYGVIGLGAGSLACHSEPDEAWRFYEIDPVVVAIAHSKHFTFLANCQPKADIMLGDARLTLAKEQDASFDLLIVDAFSSDAIPMHLLTAEAIGLYAGKLKEGGIGVLHISNRYLDLEGVLEATLRLVPGVKAFAVEDPKPDEGYAVTGSTVVVFSKDMEMAHRFLRIRGARTLNIKDMRPWTDDASDVLGPILSQMRKLKMLN